MSKTCLGTVFGQGNLMSVTAEEKAFCDLSCLLLI